MSMSPLTRGEVITILHEGKLKYGWRWLQAEDGCWWGARQSTDVILQVRPEPPDFPTRRWSGTSEAGYTPTPRWEALRSVF